jgi:cytochrome c-type biogenesis protein CcmH/NrfG
MNEDRNVLTQAPREHTLNTTRVEDTVAELANKTEKLTSQTENTIQQINALSTKVQVQIDEVKDTKVKVSQTSQITFFGFIIALITLGAIVIGAITYVYTAVKQTTEQTLLLQEIKDKVSK